MMAVLSIFLRLDSTFQIDLLAHVMKNLKMETIPVMHILFLLLEEMKRDCVERVTSQLVVPDQDEE